ncbi:sensor domain-containing diguanylate cyclase [[Clostridium] symbiosum]|uniref:sensor domain-containing diguanylate cyclase n=1 Tax=Clostridium symbiosum TaxID=1512 RepID=UPI001D061A67|nr:sensor domain-containing diguanylate cyclase [[Clostridium] symbiosum]MCB6608419.1 sensor domain-containing diguanylate cyclase [[Clostridium] symbiosum]MCB6930633.1 sensor domain-containing diguanylate cyclase [[Clostridium] symbiosum]
MENNRLFKTNVLVSLILVIGFALTAMLSYRANYEASLDSIEQVSSLTAEGIYYQLSTKFAKPVNISLTMAHDSLLKNHLLEESSRLEDEEYIKTTKTYLDTYREKYGFDSVFLVSAASSRYYNFNGVDRILTEDSPENTWYYKLLQSDEEYSLNVDNDEVAGADNVITVFVNCKVKADDGSTLGIVGVGIRIEYLKELLQGYEDKFDVTASLLNRDGMIEVSTTYNGYEQRDWFKINGCETIRGQVLDWKSSDTNLEVWASQGEKGTEKSYVVARYIPELSWYLTVEQDTGQILSSIRIQLYMTAILLLLIIVTVLIVITAVIRNFNKQITELMEERQGSFKRATEQLYDNIYELNITKNCTVGKRTEAYFGSLGAGDLPYSEGLHVIAEKQIKEEFREGYVSTFEPSNVIKEYESGNNHLRYDFQITQDGTNYFWMRIDAYIFYSSEDDSIHMFTYRKNIEEEKEKEMQAVMDEMTQFYTKTETERLIEAVLAEHRPGMYAFFIFDIDNFKKVNDQLGHVFGDYCIREFTGIIKRHFENKDILGRIGGDEFVAFAEVPDMDSVRRKAGELTRSLDTVIEYQDMKWNISASIGVAVYPSGGLQFVELYRNADRALYQTKERGKNGFTIHKPVIPAE